MQQFFIPHILAVFFWLTFFAGIAIELRSGSKHKPSQRTKTGLQNDILTVLITSFGVFLALLLKAVLPKLIIYRNPALFWLGLTIAWAGIILRLMAIKTLGKFFVMTIITQENQPVITTGPYRFIRHPSYLGGLLFITGTAIALNSLPGAILMIISSYLVILQRIRVEERYLVLKLGQPYLDYVNRTKKLFPFIW